MRDKFLITIVLSLIISVVAIAYIVLFIAPSDLYLAALLILIGYSISVFVSLILYIFSKKERNEDRRQFFRKRFRIGIVIGLIVVIIMLFQRALDFI